MAELFTVEGGRLVARLGSETLIVEAWGSDALRVRATPSGAGPDDTPGALLPWAGTPAEIAIAAHGATVTCGRIAAELGVVRRLGGFPARDLVLRFVDTTTGAELCRETRPHFTGPAPRHFRARASRSWRLEATFAAYDGERLYGMGQMLHGRLDLKGSVIDLQQKNGHVTIPLVLSSRGYALLWNNPAVGRAEFGTNHSRWVAEATPQLDYWIAAGADTATLLGHYANATGHAPDLPAWAAGLWQSRLRYTSQAEVMAVADGYRDRSLPLSCIVIDFFHWTRQGEWRFDPVAWPDPSAMVAALKERGITVMVSVWPTVSPSADSLGIAVDQGLLVDSDRGTAALMLFVDRDPLAPTYVHYYDPTNPAARAFLWERLRAGYLVHGIENFWLDACEPEIQPGDMDNLRLHAGNGAEVANLYPVAHHQGIHDGLSASGAASRSVLLSRSAWAGSQRYGVLLWSGDVDSSFAALAAQVRAGLSAGLSGIGWWTSDIGGFYGGVGTSAAFRELLVRWFEFGVFCPVTRLHGFRVPDDAPPQTPGAPPRYGATIRDLFIRGGGANEPWSFGDAVLAQLRALIALREALRPYVLDQMAIFARTGLPPMRPLFVDFPEDPVCWTIDDSYMFGADCLVAPVTVADVRQARVYLPAGAHWTHAWTGAVHAGGGWAEVAAPLGQIPVFVRDGAHLPGFPPA